MIHVACKSCGRKFTVPDDRAGTRVKCPGCNTALGVSLPQLEELIDVGTPRRDTTPAKPQIKPQAVPQSSKTSVVSSVNGWSFLAGAAVTLGICLAIYWAIPKPRWDRLAETASPGFMLAAVETGRNRPLDRSRANEYNNMLDDITKYYISTPRSASWDVLQLVSRLSEDGMPADPYNILMDALWLAMKAERQGNRFVGVNFYDFIRVYESRRRDNLAHNQAIEKMDSEHDLVK